MILPTAFHSPPTFWMKYQLLPHPPVPSNLTFFTLRLPPTRSHAGLTWPCRCPLGAPAPMSLCDAPALTAFGLCSTSALHQPVPDVTLTPLHTDTRSVPPPKGFSSYTCHSCITLTTVWGLLPPSQEGRACVPTPRSPAATGMPQPERGTGATVTAAGGPGTSLLSSVSLSPVCNGTAGFLGGTAEDSVSRGPPALLAPDTSLAGEMPTGWVPGGWEATAPREPRLLEVRQPETMPPGSPQWGSGRP